MAMDKIREFYQKQKEKEPSQYIEAEKEDKKPPQKSVLSIRYGEVGNPYNHRYKYKVETILTEVEYEHYLENAKQLETKRLDQKENPSYPFDYLVQVVSISGLLATLYYTGLRITEIVGDVPHKYKVFKRDEHGNILEDEKGNRIKVDKWTKELHGLRKMDLSIKDNLLKVDVKEARKHGKREEPLWIPLDKLGVSSIVEAWKSAKEPEDRIFPITKWLGWKLISLVTEGRLYPHFFRLNRATEFANNPETSLLELKKWFAWADARTASFYMGRAGRTTKKMAGRL